jgi:excisionase family DNA binding protein
VSPDAKLLVGREEAAEILSLSIRSIDYLLASKELPFRKIGSRTMIPLSALHTFVRMHHPERIAS